MKLAIYRLISFVFTIFTYSQNQDYDASAQIITQSNNGSPSLSSASWTSLPNSPNGVSRSCCVYIRVGNVPYLYQFGGGNSNNELRRGARLNLNTNTWTNNYTSMPSSISPGTALALRGDRI